MIEIFAVCTGNVCRSPLAELLLRARLADYPVSVESAGTRGRPPAMTPDAKRLVDMHGALAGDADEHRARYLTERMLKAPDLILGMAREHRRAIVELVPSKVQVTFTLREFERLAQAAQTSDLEAAAQGSDAGTRLRGILRHLSSLRGRVIPPHDAADDDVIDPFGRSWNTYQLSASQLVPAVDVVARIVELARPGH
ncbi:low molecular weight phosphatase family protein [Microbacterium sp.]|uniref:arsenate reductase/protein-tyrosine-phosphatase family protein n=1 Tax=Microbacterium sp. TaxID=51671 RepID=UPI0025DFA98C|nr:low molecular weight phosphatase family protein [Microbacterium sp.]